MRPLRGAATVVALTDAPGAVGLRAMSSVSCSVRSIPCPGWIRVVATAMSIVIAI